MLLYDKSWLDIEEAHDRPYLPPLLYLRLTWTFSYSDDAASILKKNLLVWVQG